MKDFGYKLIDLEDELRIFKNGEWSDSDDDCCCNDDYCYPECYGDE